MSKYFEKNLKKTFKRTLNNFQPKSRKGLGMGLGKGFKNMIPQDPFVHSMSARGVSIGKFVTSPKEFFVREELNPSHVKLIYPFSSKKKAKAFLGLKAKGTRYRSLPLETREKLEDLYGQEVPEYLDVVNKNLIKIKVSDWQGEKTLNVTPADVIQYYDKEARNITSGARTLAGHTGDWRPIDAIAKESLEVFKVLNRNELERLGKKRGMTLKAKGRYPSGTEELMDKEWGWNYMKQPKKKLNAKRFRDIGQKRMSKKRYLELGIDKEMESKFTPEQLRVLRNMNLQKQGSVWSLKRTKQPNELFVLETQLGISHGEAKKLAVKFLDTLEEYPESIDLHYLGYEGQLNALSIDQAKKLQFHDVVTTPAYKNADGTPQRWRVMGKVKTWKKDPNRIRVPIKRGLYDHYEITQDNLDMFDKGE